MESSRQVRQPESPGALNTTTTYPNLPGVGEVWLASMGADWVIYLVLEQDVGVPETGRGRIRVLLVAASDPYDIEDEVVVWWELDFMADDRRVV